MGATILRIVAAKPEVSDHLSIHEIASKLGNLEDKVYYLNKSLLMINSTKNTKHFMTILIKEQMM